MRLFLMLPIAGALLITACYNQPVISPQRPLKCNPTDKTGQCPKGFSCASVGLCAPQSCSGNADCPAGLVCSSRGCVPVPDAGADGAIQIPNQPDGAVKPSEVDGGAPEVQELDLAAASPDGGGID